MKKHMVVTSSSRLVERLGSGQTGMAPGTESEACKFQRWAEAHPECDYDVLRQVLLEARAYGSSAGAMVRRYTQLRAEQQGWDVSEMLPFSQAYVAFVKEQYGFDITQA